MDSFKHHITTATNSTPMGKKKDTLPSNNTDMNKDKHQWCQFPFDPALDCTYCAHNGHSVDQ
jgi:hypothetical protein